MLNSSVLISLSLLSLGSYAQTIQPGNLTSLENRTFTISNQTPVKVGNPNSFHLAGLMNGAQNGVDRDASFIKVAGPGNCAPPRVSVEVKPEQLFLRTDVPQNQLQNHSKRDPNTYKPGRWHTLGIYHAPTKVNASLKSLSYSQTSACVSQIDLVISYTQTIFIANEIPTYTCTYENVYAHELVHARIQKETLEQMVPSLRQYLSALRPVITGTDTHSMRTNLNLFLRQVVDNIQPAISQQLNSAQSQIDTVENYEAESMRCPINDRILVQQLIKKSKNSSPSTYTDPSNNLGGINGIGPNQNQPESLRPKRPNPFF